MSNKYKSLIKDTLIFAVGSLGSKLILFFMVPLYTNYLSTSDYGIADLVFSVSQLIIPIASLVISEAVIRFGLSNKEKKENIALSAFVVLSCSIIFTIAVTPLIGLYEAISSWKWYLCVYVILSNFSEVERTYLKVKDRNKAFAVISIVNTLVLACMNIILIAVFHLGIRGYLLSNIVAIAVVVIITFFVAGLHKDLFRAVYDSGLTKSMIMYSAPLIIGNISWWVIHGSDRFMIERMIDSAALGLYTASSKIPSIINIFIGIFNQAWGISSIKEIESTRDTYYYYHVFDLFSVVLFSVCMFVLTIIKPFMSFYVGKDFQDSWRYVPLLLAAAVYFALQAFLGTLYSALKRTSNIMWTTLVCAIANLIVNLTCIPKFGVFGAVFGTIISYWIIMHIRLYDIKKYMLFKPDMICLVINEVLLIASAVMVTLDYIQPYFAIALLLVFGIVNSKRIIELFKSINKMLVVRK